MTGRPYIRAIAEAVHDSERQNWFEDKTQAMMQLNHGNAGNHVGETPSNSSRNAARMLAPKQAMS